MPSLEKYRNRAFAMDCLEFLSQLPGESIDCVLIDPPYCSGGKRMYNRYNKYRDFEGDNKSQRIWMLLISEVFRAVKRVLKPSAYFFSFIDWRQYPALSDCIQLADLAWRGVIVWNKGNGSRPFANAFKQQCEFILWGTKGTLPLTSRKEANYYFGYVEKYLHPSQKQHPTQKPIEVLKHCLQVVPKIEGQEPPVVLDCFCGSGSTGVACAELGLDFIGVELSKEYAIQASINLEGALLHAQENKQKEEKEAATTHIYF
ncbi:DNA-methyltransferase [Helicobacter suis]|uniref:Methyltransferase n=1 Tax=Helicobacter suis TaxID=104628 RepID=A0A6J4CZR6_9HELI|nr:site-specific DNA-methyltransferase [Helicobacter suis]BCD45540.1 Methyltransferase [Helicobacter suis]BCD50733.1 Methyltransferase [Helicobacter suis]BCD70252.1 Methyltransferase [Helicobacter suis]BDR27721.1 methyltransferase [Helicobacter suis HS1]